MGWIKNRIDAEYRKHQRLDWSRISEAKIIGDMKKLVDKAFSPKIDGEETKLEIHKELLKMLNNINKEPKEK